MALGALCKLLTAAKLGSRHYGPVTVCALARPDSAVWEPSNGSRTYTTSSSSTTAGLADHGSLADASLQLSQQLQDVSSLPSFAAQPLEPLWQFLNPVVLGSSVWEMVHSTTGLPWWASIPLTTIALRTALSPLTIKAKSAGLNWVLLQHSFQTANRLLEQMQQGRGAPVIEQQQRSGHLQQLKKPSKLKLVRMYYRYFRKQHKTTSMWWWTVNAVAQVNVFVIMSAALRNMSAVQWPGFTSEGLAWFTDLTQPAANWSTLVCPYGVAGIGLPFLLMVLYKATVDRSPAANRQRLELLLQTGNLPIFILSTMVPQATLLYWLSNSAFFLGMQEALKQPKLARRLGIPTVMLPPPTTLAEEMERAEQEAADVAEVLSQDGSEDAGYLMFVAANYHSRGKYQQALQCLQRLTVLAPGNSGAFSALGHTAAELQQWPVAAAAYERSAELSAAAGDQDEQARDLVLAGKHWLTAVAEARQLRKTAAGKLGRDSGTGSSSNGSEAVSAEVESAAAVEAESTGSAVAVHKQQAYLDSALRVLQAAVALPSSNASDGWYLLATARAAAHKCADALAAGQTYWSKACAAAESDPLAKSNAAAKLLPVLVSVAGKCQVPADKGLLLQTAELAAEVAESRWDRQSHEKLQEVLGAAAQAANKDGNYAFAEQLKQLKAKVQSLDVGQRKLTNTKWR